jgi:heat shock protein HtpX
MNGIKTVLLLGLLSGVLLYGGEMFGGRNGLYMGLGMAVVMNFASYFFSDKIALKMSNAHPLTQEQFPHAYRIMQPMTERLTQKMGLPMPKLYITPEQSPNAFATGRNPAHAAVAVTEGLLQLMDERELEGVVAHELGHVLHRDILISSIAATLGAAITMLARMAMWFGGGSRDDEDRPNPMAAMAMMILAPIAAMMIQMAISRTREYSADAAAAKYTGSPDGLISALRKLESYSKRIPMDAPQVTAHMYIIKPFSKAAFANMFSTHPATEQRVAALEGLRGNVLPLGTPTRTVIR